MLQVDPEQTVWVSVAHVLVLSSDDCEETVPQLAVQVGDGGPLEKCVVGLPLFGGQSIEKISRNLKQGNLGIDGASGRLGISISGNSGVGKGTGDQ